MEVLLNECEVMKMMKSISCILLICILGLMAYAEETQEQKVERLIKQLQDKHEIKHLTLLGFITTIDE